MPAGKMGSKISRTLSHRRFWRRHRPGTGLLVVILVLAFLLGTGMLLMTITTTGSKTAGNLRSHHEAFNAAEAGFDAAWLAVDQAFADSEWINFDDRYLKEPDGIDLPYSVNYFRKLTDDEILEIIDPDGDGNPDVANVIFCRQPFITLPDGTLDPDYTYTAFLIDDEALLEVPADASDALLVCIGVAGRGANRSTARLEIELAIELPGM
ncbi:MAG: pilus assembly PilX N-terminal domain-containing protein [Candidatus Aminicenantes bacterium]